MSAYGKFLQIIVVYLTLNDEHHRIEKIFSKFNKDYSELSTLFNGIQEIPEEKEVILKRQEAIQTMMAHMENLTIEAGTDEKKVSLRRHEIIKRTKGETKEEFDEAELTIPEELASIMEMNALFGFLDEANAQRHKKSKLSGRQNFTRKNFPDEARKSFSRQKSAKSA